MSKPLTLSHDYVDNSVSRQKNNRKLGSTSSKSKDNPLTKTLAEDEDIFVLQKHHTSLFYDNDAVMNYTDMLKSAVKDMTFTTKVVPHLSD